MNHLDKRTGALVVGVASVAADQLTKLWSQRFGACTAANDTGGWLCPTRNDELMLNVAGTGGPHTVVWSLTGLALYGLWVALAGRHASIPPVAVALVLGGVVGNLVDRVVFGEARDFIGLPWAVINVADIVLVVGLLWTALALLAALAASRSITGTTTPTVTATETSEPCPSLPSRPESRCTTRSRDRARLSC